MFGTTYFLFEADTTESMKAFHCGSCNQLVFFQNSVCVQCARTLAYLPDRDEMGTLEPGDGTNWRWISANGERETCRLCLNYSQASVCNWAVPAGDPDPYCQSCRLNRVIPNLTQPGAQEAWGKLEAAKRRLVYTLLRLRLPVSSKADDPESGLAFQFLADPDPTSADPAPVRTGHLDGVITINLAEADDAKRERRRREMLEPYRTLLGHFRHESGHYYWDRLVRGRRFIERFRQHFGDERQDYSQSLARHHQQGAPGDWPGTFVSAYASAHPWEDWAETWAHYLHITDTMETAFRCGLQLAPRRSDEPTWNPEIPAPGRQDLSFDQMIEGWFPLTYVLNNLNRCMGLQDAYPFVLSVPVLDKLRFVHDVVRGSAPPASH